MCSAPRNWCRSRRSIWPRTLPAYRWFGRGRRADGSDEHMGVFYDSNALSVIESGDFWLSEIPEIPGSSSWNTDLPRMVTWALFERRNDKRRFYLLNTHLPHRDQDEAAREHVARVILSRIATLPADIPVVVTGDFNSDPDQGTYRTLTAVLGDARAHVAKPQGPEKTFQNFTTQPTRRIDWILFRGLTPTRFFPRWTRAPGVSCRPTITRSWPHLSGHSEPPTHAGVCVADACRQMPLLHY